MARNRAPAPPGPTKERTMLAEQTDPTAALDALYADMDRLYLEGHWRIGDEVQATRPRVATRPHVWRGADVAGVLMRAGELVRHGEAAERGPLRMAAPGPPAQHSAATPLAGSAPPVRPGEIAPPPRHTPSAIRFIIRGE